MTEPSAPRLWTPGGFREDPWRHAGEAGALAADDRLILPLPAYLALDAGTRSAAAGRVGVSLQPGDALDAILPALDALPLVALAFPAFADGRSFSKAELLRGRYRFRGIVRATGQVLVDQLPHMLRVGFDQFEVANPVLLRRLEAGLTGGLPLHYQPAAAGGEVPGAAAYAWRRVSNR